MAGGNNFELNKKPTDASKGSTAEGSEGHAQALHDAAYAPAALNHQKMNGDGTLKANNCAPGPKLTELTIDTTPGHVVVHDVASRDANAQDKREAAKRDMPISNEHFQDLVKKGTDFMASNDGTFNLQMRNALNEANQSDKSMKDGHTHVDEMLKYANAHLCNTDYTLERKGNVVEVFDSSQKDTKTPSARWNLDKNAYER